MCGVQRLRNRNGLYLKDDVPFSCCDPSVIRPCVHQAMRDRTRHAKYPVGSSTLYNVGCSVAVHLHVASVGSWILYGLGTLAAATVALLVTCRYLQTSISEALHTGNALLPSRGYLLSFGRRNVPGTRAPPPTPATQPSSPQPAARDDKVATTDAKRRRRRRRNTNKSNIEANNSAALYDLAEDLLSDNASPWSVNTDLELIAEQLAPSSISDRTQPTSGEPSDGGTASGLPLPTVDDPGTAIREISVVQSSDSQSLSVGSSSFSTSSQASRLHDNRNSNAKIDSHSLRSSRPTRSLAPSRIAPVVRDRHKNDVTISRDRGKSKSSDRWQTRKYREQCRSPRMSTSNCDRRNVVYSQRLTRVKGAERSYRTTEKPARDRMCKRYRCKDISIDWSNSCRFPPPQRVTAPDRIEKHRAKNHRHVPEERSVGLHSKSLSGSYSTSGSVSSSAEYLSGTSREKTLRRSSSARERRVEVGCVYAMNESVGSLETRNSEDARSSEWSTVSCQTVGSLPESRRSTSTRRRVTHNSAAALLSLSNYLRTYNGDRLTSTESHKSRRCRSKNSSTVVQKSLPSTANFDGRMRQTVEMVSTSKNGRSSNNSWSTVSHQTLSRPPSTKFHGDIIVEEERACSSTSQTTPEQTRQANNNCNSVLERRSSFDVVSGPETRRHRQSENSERVDRDRMSLSATNPWTVGHASYDYCSMVVNRSASTKQLCGRQYNKPTTRRHPPLVHTVIHAMQLCLDAPSPSTTSVGQHRASSSSFQPGLIGCGQNTSTEYWLSRRRLADTLQTKSSAVAERPRGAIFH